MKEIKFKISKDDLLLALQHSSVTEDGEVYICFPKVKDLQIPKEQLTPGDYQKFSYLIKKYAINLKDMRVVIMLANSWWSVGSFFSDQVVIEKYLSDKEKFRENTYSWELISLILEALSKCKDPISDFYSRIHRVDPGKYEVFVDYLKEIYTEHGIEE